MIVLDKRTVLEHPEGYISCSACDVEDRLPTAVSLGAVLYAGVYGAHEVVFPESVGAEGHEVVHGVVGGGDGGEDGGDAGLLGGGGHGLEAEVRCWVWGILFGCLLLVLLLLLGEKAGAREAAVGRARGKEAVG